MNLPLVLTNYAHWGSPDEEPTIPYATVSKNGIVTIRTWNDQIQIPLANLEQITKDMRIYVEAAKRGWVRP